MKEEHHWSEDLRYALGKAILAMIGAGLIGAFMGYLVGTWR